MEEKVLDSSVDGIESCHFERFVGVIESCGGFTNGACLIDAM